MQTATEWLIDKIVQDQMYKAISQKEWIDIFEQAKKMEKQQIIQSYRDCHGLGHIYGFDGEEYYNETYGSKGSDEKKKIRFTEEEWSELNNGTSQTEISDEEEWAAALKLTDNIQEHNGWEKAIKWYREQLKLKLK